MASLRKAVLVTRRTRIEELVARFHTIAQAKFYVEHLGADFSDYELEHANYVAARQTVERTLQNRCTVQLLDRAFLPSYLFAPDDIVVALGQDGLVANTIKYLDGQPLIGINPDSKRFDGILLPFMPEDLQRIMDQVLADQRPFKTVTMAKATLSDGQSLHAVNDLFIGPKSHTSARYEIELGGQREMQSSSGLIVSTGLGSTAWMKSIVTGSMGVAAAFLKGPSTKRYKPIPWDAPYLQFAVREPFPSIASQAELVFGRVDTRHPLLLRSFMPENGVIFSDGMENDFLQFNSGMNATITLAERAGRLIH